MKLLVDIIRAVRNIRAEVNTPMSKQINLMLKAKDEDTLRFLRRMQPISSTSVIRNPLNCALMHRHLKKR